MSMFDKRKENEPAKEAPSSSAPAPEPRQRNTDGPSRTIAVIGKSITIKGDVTGDESLVVEGTVDGTVHLKNSDLTVGQTGRVKASVSADTVRVEGEVTGDINGVEKVVLTKTGRLQGNIVAPRVTLEDGAKFKGSIDMDPGPAQKAAAPEPLKSVSPSAPAAPAAPKDQTGEPVRKV